MSLIFFSFFVIRECVTYFFSYRYTLFVSGDKKGAEEENEGEMGNLVKAEEIFICYIANTWLIMS